MPSKASFSARSLRTDASGRVRDAAPGEGCQRSWPRHSRADAHHVARLHDAPLQIRVHRHLRGQADHVALQLALVGLQAGGAHSERDGGRRKVTLSVRGIQAQPPQWRASGHGCTRKGASARCSPLDAALSVSEWTAMVLDGTSPGLAHDDVVGFGVVAPRAQGRPCVLLGRRPANPCTVADHRHRNGIIESDSVTIVPPRGQGSPQFPGKFGSVRP